MTGDWLMSGDAKRHWNDAAAATADAGKFTIVICEREAAGCCRVLGQRVKIWPARAAAGAAAKFNEMRGAFRHIQPLVA